MLKKNDLVHYFRRYERFKIYSTTSLTLMRVVIYKTTSSLKLYYEGKSDKINFILREGIIPWE